MIGDDLHLERESDLTDTLRRGGDRVCFGRRADRLGPFKFQIRTVFFSFLLLY